MLSCDRQALSPEELSAFVVNEEHGLRKSAEINSINIAVTYRPVDLLVYQETGKQKVEEQEVENLRNKYSQYLYFILSLSHDNKEALHHTGGDQYSDLVQTLSFRMNEYVTMTTAANDTIPVGDFMLNRTYGMSSSTDILFVFNKEKAKGQDWIQFNLNEFGLGTGNQRFRFNMDKLDNAPQIKFETK
jgi:hypothetical protein